ncbi:MAG TPA: HD domain-containing protein, partial [Desulfobulbaceae bacterium]|nr:HD domain-containing protein [Desulfobulbaceae bacterium]
LENESGSTPVPDRALVLAGALLHDIAKTPCLDGSCDHAAFGAEICKRHGYPEVAGIVKEHVILQEHDPARYESGLFTAREIVYYADKRVRHAQIVSLKQRLEYIINQYGNNDPKRHALIRENFERCLQMEEAIFALLPFTPVELEYHVHFPKGPTKKER